MKDLVEQFKPFRTVYVDSPGCRDLDLAHKKLDAALFAAYGWPDDLSDEGTLERLLRLNLERAG